jgi:tetratricopeptide (TPR) repeat protein
VLDRFKPAATLPSPLPQDIDQVFARMRDEASRRQPAETAEQDLAVGITLYESGRLDEAAIRLEAASRAPGYRFDAARTLGRIFLERGDTWAAIDWLERAAQAPASSPADGHRLLYELADALEAVGEVARALAVCLELRAEAGDYQDVTTRVDRLSKVQLRG